MKQKTLAMATGFERFGKKTNATLYPELTALQGLAGPPLNHFADRLYIAGRLPNTPENLMLWIQKPQQVVPNNVMPDIGISEQDSRDRAAYLYTLH